MAVRFEELVNDMVNIGFGAAAMAADKSREVLEDLNQRGEAARNDVEASDFARSMSDIFEKAGGVISDATERLSATGASTSEKILDELIRARVRDMPEDERAAFVDHVQKLVDSVGAKAVDIEVEVEVVDEDSDDEDVDDEDEAGDAEDEKA